MHTHTLIFNTAANKQTHAQNNNKKACYYVWAVLTLRPSLGDGDIVDFYVPTGAFGNAMGGYGLH